MENKFEAVKFEILEKTELQAEYDGIAKEISELRKVAEGLVQEIRTKIDMLNEQRNATESKVWEDANRIRRRHAEAVEYIEALEYKKNFDKALAKVVPIYGIQNYFYTRGDYGGRICLRLSPEVVAEISEDTIYIYTNDRTQLVHKYWYQNTPTEDKVEYFNRMKEFFASKTMEELQKEAVEKYKAEITKQGYKIHEEFGVGKYILSYLSGGSGYVSVYMVFEITEKLEPQLRRKDSECYAMISYAKRWFNGKN